MIKLIDRFLNRITMYRLVLYTLIILLGVALVFSFAGILPYDPFALLLSVALLVALSWLTNTIFAKVFGVPTNVESAYITALILALIIDPLSGPGDFWFIVWAAVLAMASKYIVAIKGKHLFNPAAFAVALTALAVGRTASWWIGSAPMLPFVLLGGLLIVRKLRRVDLVMSFLLTSLAAVVIFTVLGGGGLGLAMQNILLYSPLFFFATIILTEPLTTPPTTRLQVAYGALVGILFIPQFHLGSLYLTPELAILFGNIFSYLVSPKAKLILSLKDRVQVAPGIYDFIFVPNQILAFEPGQYMEWTLGHQDPDNRGNRRYFTLASSPTERLLRVGVKFYQNSSSFKQSLLRMRRGSEIVASQLAGDFVLPRDPRQPCVFIAGGIGITPFRSMITFLLDTRQPRPITLFYANKTVDEIAYKDVFDRAWQELGIRTFYTLTNRRSVPPDWNGMVGRITPEMIVSQVSDYKNCIFYLSGPNAMVDSFKRTLRAMGVRSSHIKADFFPGLS
jgi:ferredoxin-NADP reductase/Na+-translocating ferredoxin:NAD+ oxidoreductase RnfD subunit